jgi:hypothetical protein
MAEGGLDKLDANQLAGAKKSYAAWADAKPALAARYDFTDYVGFVQAQYAGQKDMHRLDRMAEQMGRIEENRAAHAFEQGFAPRPQEPPAQDALREAAGEATERRAAITPEQAAAPAREAEKAAPEPIKPDDLDAIRSHTAAAEAQRQAERLFALAPAKEAEREAGRLLAEQATSRIKAEEEARGTGERQARIDAEHKAAEETAARKPVAAPLSVAEQIDARAAELGAVRGLAPVDPAELAEIHELLAEGAKAKAAAPGSKEHQRALQQTANVERELLRAEGKLPGEDSDAEAEAKKADWQQAFVASLAEAEAKAGSYSERLHIRAEFSQLARERDEEKDDDKGRFRTREPDRGRTR